MEIPKENKITQTSATNIALERKRHLYTYGSRLHRIRRRIKSIFCVMGRAACLNEVEKGQIKVLHAEGLSNRQIALNIKRSGNVIDSFLKNPEEYGTKKSPGRKRKLNSRAHRRIQRTASNSQKSARNIKDELKPDVSSKMVLRAIKRAPHLVRQKMKSSPKLDVAHIAARNRIARERMGFGEKWDRVVFSDEKKFNLDGPDGFSYYWRDLRKDPRHSLPGILVAAQ